MNYVCSYIVFPQTCSNGEIWVSYPHSRVVQRQDIALWKREFWFESKPGNKLSMQKPTPEEIEEINKNSTEKTKRDFERFRKAFRQGECAMCSQRLDSFYEDKPCMHWLLNPQGFKKKHFSLIYNNFNYTRLDPYLRWVANCQATFRQINDIKVEHTPGKIISTTITYENLEWSFSCSPNDLKGHGKWPPHYHFQMRIDGRQFINYGEFHIPFTKYDLWGIDIMQGKHPFIKHRQLYDMGVGGVLKEVEPEILLEHMQYTDDEAKSTFDTSTLIVAKDGKAISGEEIAELIEARKRTGKPIARLVKDKGNLNATVIISPGEGVPKAAYRKGGRKRRGKKN